MLTDGLSQLSQPQDWVAVVQIIWIDILLSGDNAVVIALACRCLPRRQRRWGMIVGAGVAAVLLVTFSFVVTTLIQLPYLRLVSAGALIWIAAKLVDPAPDGDDEGPAATTHFWQAVRVIVTADIIMSLDNVVAVAAVANGRYILIGLGLIVSIPIVFAGSAVILALLDRLPVIVWGGAALLGWVAGQLLVSDPVIASHLDAGAQLTIHQWSIDLSGLIAGALGAAIVLAIGGLRRRSQAPPPNDGAGADGKM